MNTKKSKRKSGGGLGYLITVALFAVVLVVIIRGTMGVSGTASAEGVAATKKAIERAAVVCYAAEGHYPPSLQYIEDNYGVVIDYGRYAVRYEVFSPGITPVVQVVPRGS